MTDIESSARPRQYSTVLITGTVLVGVAAVLGLTGFTMTTAALIAAARRRMDRMEVPPTDLAKQAWARTRAATSAGVAAWRNGDGQPVAEVRIAASR
jgi:hypothetical protein